MIILVGLVFTLGQLQDSITAYRTFLHIQPSFKPYNREQLLRDILLVVCVLISSQTEKDQVILSASNSSPHSRNPPSLLVACISRGRPALSRLE